MDAIHSELAKLHTLSGTQQGKWPSISSSIDSLLVDLRDARGKFQTEQEPPQVVALNIRQTVEDRKKAIDERQKEIYNSLNRFAKSLDKRFPSTLPTWETPLFAQEESERALENVVAAHLLRTGQFEVADTFFTETESSRRPELEGAFKRLHALLSDLKQGDPSSAIKWAAENRHNLEQRNSPLEFSLHKIHYLSMVTKHDRPDQTESLNYLRQLPASLYGSHGHEIRRMVTALLFLPIEKLLASPYADLLDPSLAYKTETELVSEYCASLGLSRALPLKTVGAIGAGGALARIEKSRKVMRENKSEWSQVDELPIEIPLPPEYRYHSTFACMVSKEQATEANPPMMIPCGHVLAKDSLSSMVKAGRLKCPYCPSESSPNSAVRIHF